MCRLEKKVEMQTDRVCYIAFIYSIYNAVKQSPVAFREFTSRLNLRRALHRGPTCALRALYEIIAFKSKDRDIKYLPVHIYRLYYAPIDSKSHMVKRSTSKNIINAFRIY